MSMYLQTSYITIMELVNTLIQKTNKDHYLHAITDLLLY